MAYLTLAPLLGTAAASMLFAVALLASGQSSTITGTLAGQVVMEGFMHWRTQPLDSAADYPGAWPSCPPSSSSAFAATAASTIC